MLYQHDVEVVDDYLAGEEDGRLQPFTETGDTWSAERGPVGIRPELHAGRSKTVGKNDCGGTGDYCAGNTHSELYQNKGPKQTYGALEHEVQCQVLETVVLVRR